MRLVISGVKLTPAPATERSAGLLGWISCTVGEALRLDGLALRRTREGVLTIAFPCRKDGAGRKHYVVRPLDDEARKAIERQVLEQLEVLGRRDGR